jgi:hypothetical protein
MAILVVYRVSLSTQVRLSIRAMMIGRESFQPVFRPPPQGTKEVFRITATPISKSKPQVAHILPSSYSGIVVGRMPIELLSSNALARGLPVRTREVHIP